MGSGAQMEVLALDEVTGRKMAVGQREMEIGGCFWTTWKFSADCFCFLVKQEFIS